MGRFQQVYTPEQCAVIARAIVHNGMSAPKAVKAAAGGELGLPAFEMKLSTAQYYAAKEREVLAELNRKALAKKSVADAGPEQLARLMEALALEVDRIVKASQANKPTTARIAACARAIGEIAAAERKLKPEQSRSNGKAKQGQQGEGSTHDKPAAPTLLDKLAAMEKPKRKRAPEQKDNPTPIGEGGEDNDQATTATVQTATRATRATTEQDGGQGPVYAAPRVEPSASRSAGPVAAAL